MCFSSNICRHLKIGHINGNYSEKILSMSIMLSCHVPLTTIAFVFDRKCCDKHKTYKDNLFYTCNVMRKEKGQDFVLKKLRKSTLEDYSYSK